MSVETVTKILDTYEKNSAELNKIIEAVIAHRSLNICEDVEKWEKSLEAMVDLKLDFLSRISNLK